MSKRAVAVLYGGVSQEREVSLATGRACAKALREAGYTVEEIDWSPRDSARLFEEHFDAVFLALHGGLGEEGSVQGMLNCAGVPYTGSGVLASAIAMDKVVSKQLFVGSGLSTPASRLVTRSEAEALSMQAADTSALLEAVGLPVVVKPAREGSSVGVTIVEREEELAAAIVAARRGDDCILLEAFVDGPELSVGIFDDQVLGVVEIAPADGFYDYAAKYQSATTQYRIPPHLDAATCDAAAALAKAAYDLVGCRGVARVDLMVGADGEPLLLEINTLAGMTATSLVPKLAEACGESFPHLVARMVEAARTDEA